MLFDTQEVRSELIRMFSVQQLNHIQEQRRDMLIVEEKMGKCRYEEIEGEIPKNKWNIFNLRDQQILTTDIVNKYVGNGRKSNQNNNRTLLGKLSGFLSYSISNLNQKVEEDNIFKNQSNELKTGHYFLFNKMSINSVGTYMALFTDNINDHLILLVNLKTFRHFCLKSLQEIVSFSWHPIEVCQFSYSTHDRTKHYSFSQDNETTLFEIGVIEHNASSQVVKWLTCPNGQSSLLLTQTHISLYDITFKKIFEKSFKFKSFINACFAPNSSFFVLFTIDELFIFNSLTLDFKSYSNFPGAIKDVLISNSSNYVYALISKGNDILFYTIYNLSEDDYNIPLYQSYNNTQLSYIHSTYKLHYNVYRLLANIQQLERAEFSSDNKRLALLYKSDMGDRYLCLYDIAIGNSVHHFSIQPILLIQSFKGYSIKDFTMGFDYSQNLNSLFINWTDRFISKVMINVPEQSR